ncbi:MAG: S4 domain-containing protein [Flavobacteriaceae bacterium]|nr:S4 domain-containing protein [Flavobacteriaceae bacterium]
MAGSRPSKPRNTSGAAPRKNDAPKGARPSGARPTGGRPSGSKPSGPRTGSAQPSGSSAFGKPKQAGAPTKSGSGPKAGIPRWSDQGATSDSGSARPRPTSPKSDTSQRGLTLAEKLKGMKFKPTPRTPKNADGTPNTSPGARGPRPFTPTTRTGKPIVRGQQAPKTPPKDPNIIRLNRYVANAGVCSRREADLYISSGNVTVNGKVVTEMGYQVRIDDAVRFDGRLLNPVKREYILLNKPKDFPLTTRTESGARSATSLVGNASKSILKPVGKMENKSMGLVLFTNDEALIKRLNKPKNGLKKIYQVTLNKPLKKTDLDAIAEGVLIEGIPQRVQEISYVDDKPKTEIGLEIWSSKHNMIPTLFEHLGYEIVALDRVYYAGLTKKDLPRGHWRPLTKQEVINLEMIQ